MFDHGVWLKNAVITDLVLDITFDINGNMWLGTKNGVVKRKGASVTRYLTADGLPGDIINTILIDSREMIWCGTHQLGLARFNNISWISFILPNPFPSSSDAIVVDKNDTVWSNSNNGLIFYDGSSWKAVGTGYMTPFGVDASNNIWYHDGTNIGYYDHSIFHSAVYTVPAGIQIASLNNSGKVVYISNDHKFYVTAPAADYAHTWLNFYSIQHIAQDKTNKYWFSCDAGILSLDGSTFKTYALPNNYNAKCVGQDSKGTIWALSHVGLDTLSTVADAFIELNTLLSPPKTFKIDANDNIWVACMYAVAKCDKNNTYTYRQQDGLILDYGQCISIDSKGNKWVGSYEGILKISCAPPVPDFTNDVVCYLSNTQTTITNASSVENIFTQYKWDVNADNSIDYLTKDVQHNFGGYGTYQVKLTAINDQCQSSITKDVAVSLKPDVKIKTAGSNPVCYGNTLALSADIQNEGSQTAFSYNWEGADDLPDNPTIKISEEGNYNVTVSFENCQSDPVAPIHVIVRKPYDSSTISLVTVDPLTKKNKVIWERNAGKNIVSYNIYKVYGKTYFPIANVPFDSLSVFNDLGSSPESYVSRYAISVIDSCDNESAKSPFLQTMLLSASKGTDSHKANLIWAKYEDESGNFIPEYYYIFKGKTTAQMALIDSISGILSPMYIDTAFDGISAYYRIMIKLDRSIYPAVLKAESGPYAQSLSNIVEYKTGTALDNNYISLSAYPNPFSKDVTVEFELSDGSDVRIEIINSIGQKTAEFSYASLSAGKNSVTLDAGTFSISEGICYIRVIADNTISMLKCAYQK